VAGAAAIPNGIRLKQYWEDLFEKAVFNFESSLSSTWY
jgi:hypothetical protein